jgi:aconitate decarboxylase
MVRVEVLLRDGVRLERTVELARRKQELAGESEIVEKFQNLAGHVLPKRQIEELRDGVLGLEREKDASRIARLMSVSAKSAGGKTAVSRRRRKAS